MVAHLKTTSYRYKNRQNIPNGIALRLQRVSDTDEKYNHPSSEYQNYLIGRKCNPTLVKMQFGEVSRMTTTQERASKQKSNQIEKHQYFY